MDKPDPSTFPAPHGWATFIADRRVPFKTHSTLGQAKNALSGASTVYSHTSPLVEGWVYKSVDGKWEEYAHVPAGTSKNQHPLWLKPARKVRVVSDKQVDKAIASIMKTANKP